MGELEELRAEVERLKRERQARNYSWLGETIPIADVAKGDKLTARGVASKASGMHGDGMNLWLQVTPGGRSWLFLYRWGGRQREMGLGSVVDVSLADARARAAICRRLVRAGTDPIERRRAIAASAQAPAQRTTFKQAAERYYAAKGGSWSKKHAIQFPNTMRDYVYPVLGEDLPVADVDLDRVHKVLEPIWTTKPETASRVRARMEQVLDWATTLKMRHGDNPARWRGNLSNLLPERKKVRKVTHHPALPYDKIHAFWSALETRKSASAEALRFVILTAARTSEVIGARWREFDLDKNIWTVSEDRMKARRAHRVPLSEAALAVLARMKQLKTDGDDFVFPGAKDGEPLSAMAMAMLLRKMSPPEGPSPWVDSHGKQVVPHGFRSTFRDWAAELTAHPNEMVEMALAHMVGNKVEAAYRRGDMFDRRRRLMADWATWCTTAPVQRANNVRRIGEARQSRRHATSAADRT